MFPYTALGVHAISSKETSWMSMKIKKQTMTFERALNSVSTWSSVLQDSKFRGRKRAGTPRRGFNNYLCYVIL